MRILLSLSILATLVLAPTPAPAQERVPGVVDLQRVESNATESRRSAFGRVMDVMIAALVQQQAAPETRTQAGQSKDALSLDPDSVPPRADRANAKIEIALGERFALPPEPVASRQSASIPR